MKPVAKQVKDLDVGLDPLAHMTNSRVQSPDELRDLLHHLVVAHVVSDNFVEEFLHEHVKVVGDPLGFVFSLDHVLEKNEVGPDMLVFMDVRSLARIEPTKNCL